MLWLVILAAAAADAKGPKTGKNPDFQDVLVLTVKLADGTNLRLYDCKVTEVKDEYLVAYPKTVPGREARYPKDQVVEVIRPAAAVAKRVDAPPDMKAAPPEMKSAPPDMTPTNPDPPPAVAKSDGPETKAALHTETKAAAKSPPVGDRTAARTPASEGPDWWSDPDSRNKIRYGALGAVVLGLGIVVLGARAGR